MKNLGVCMDSRVGAAAADQVNRQPGVQFGKHLLHPLLHGDTVRLNLPAAVIGTVIGDGQSDSSHGIQSFILFFS